MTSLLPAQQWTAFRIPASETISRGRLTEQFTHCSLGLVVAPPGFGKTALLAHAARAHTGPVTWYQARPGADEGELLAALGYPADTPAGSAGGAPPGRPARPGRCRGAERPGTATRPDDWSSSMTCTCSQRPGGRSWSGSASWHPRTHGS